MLPTYSGGKPDTQPSGPGERLLAVESGSGNAGVGDACSGDVLIQGTEDSREGRTACVKLDGFDPERDSQELAAVIISQISPQVQCTGFFFL